MITIFRKIRKYFIEQKKLRNYLLYAFGEIILIVLGIMVALQINNWNQRRILHKKEIVYIENIRNSLIQDLYSIESYKAFNHKKDSCIQRSFELFGSDMDNIERAEEFLQLLYTIGYYQKFRPNSVAFDNMISAESIDLISNDSLRISLSSYYSNENELEYGTQDRIKEKTHQFLDYAMPLFISNEIASKLTGISSMSHYGSSDKNEFHKDPRILYDLFMMKQNIFDQNTELENYKSQIIELLRMIEQPF